MSPIPRTLPSRSHQIVQGLSRTLTPAGIDIIHPFRLPLNFSHPLPRPDLGPQGHVAFLMGSSRAQWTPFLRALASPSHAHLLHHPNPLDTYTQERVEEALALIAPSLDPTDTSDPCTPSPSSSYNNNLEPHRGEGKEKKKIPSPNLTVWYPWEGGDRLVGFQQLGHDAGLAYYLRQTGLSLHPYFGPWFAYKALGKSSIIYA